MPELPPFLPPESTPDEVSRWEENFFEIIEDLRDNWEVYDEEALVSELQKIDESATEDDIWEYSLKIELGGDFPTVDQINSIEDGLEGTCFRTDGPDILWEEPEGVPIGPWKGSIAILGPPLKGDSFEEIQEGPFWEAWEASMDRLIELCDEHGLTVIRPQDISIGTTIWSGDNLLQGTAITLLEEEE